MSAEQFAGHWTLLESENFDEYMKILGFGYLQRKVAATVKPTNDIKIDDDGLWTITIATKFRSFTIQFKLGVEFDEETSDGRKVKSLCTLENGKLTHVQRATSPNEKNSKIERFFDESGRLIMLMECEGIVAKRIYGRAS